MLCSSACVDPARCHRTIIKALLEEAAFPCSRAVPEPPRARVLRR